LLIYNLLNKYRKYGHRKNRLNEDKYIERSGIAIMARYGRMPLYSPIQHEKEDQRKYNHLMSTYMDNLAQQQQFPSAFQQQNSLLQQMAAQSNIYQDRLSNVGYWEFKD
jgi:hypothetical protein